MFDRPYKKQKKQTPLSEEALKRFDKEIPKRRNDWYTLRAHADEADGDESIETPVDQEQTEGAGQPDPVPDFESNAAAAVAPLSFTETSEIEPAERPSLRMHPRETTSRLQFSEDGAAANSPGPSSPKMAEIRARALEEAKAKHETAANRKEAADFRVAHREAVKAKRGAGISKWADKDGTGNGTGNGNGHGRKLPIIGLLELLGVLAIVVIGIILVSKFTNRDQSDVAQTALEEPSAFASMPTQSVEEVIERFYQCETVEQMLEYVRHPEIVEPRMHEWYASHPIEATAVEILDSVEGMVSDGSINAPDQLWINAMTVQLVDSSKTVALLVERTENEGYRIDWESAASISESALKTFLAERSASPREFRVKISPDDYYNYQFADSEKWICFRVSSEKDACSCFGYVARGSQVAAKLESWFYPGESSIPVILTLQFPASSKEGVEIVDAIQKNWIRRYATAAKATESARH